MEPALKRLSIALAALALGAGAAGLVACGDDESTTTVTETEPAATPPPPDQTGPATTTPSEPSERTTEDTTTSSTTTTSTSTKAGEDVSGNCDEAEHADDPECQGSGGVAAGGDNSGPG